MNLVIDIGNTLIKIAVFDSNDESVYCQSFCIISKEMIQNIFNEFIIKNAIVSCVTEENTKLLDYLSKNTNLISFNQNTKLPIAILYESRETLGLDRIASAVGAASLFPFQNVLAIQAGTCLVCDFVNAQQEYLGGSISPGLTMRFRALHNYTNKLPQIEIGDSIPNLIGNSTTASIQSGVINGITCEIDGFINHYKLNYQELKVILTGGDAFYLQKSIKNTIFAAQNLVLKGLHEIIKYNVQ